MWLAAAALAVASLASCSGGDAPTTVDPSTGSVAVGAGSTSSSAGTSGTSGSSAPPTGVSLPGGDDTIAADVTDDTTEPSVAESVVALRDDVALVNVRPRDTPFDAVTPWPDGIGYVRAWGGSRGMVTFPTADAVPTVLRNGPDPGAFDVVGDDEIAGLLRLQALHGVQLVYMVNVNDTLDSQLAFIDRLRTAGIDIAMFEMGNELYLPKFGNGDTTKLGVSRSWTEQQYLALLAEWGPALRVLAPTVPIYAVGAAHGTSGSEQDRDRTAWNETLRTAIEQDPGIADGITFHVYASERSDSTTDIGEEPTARAVDDVVQSLHAFGDLPVAITESGYAFTDADPTGLDDAERFWESLRDTLEPGDLFGIHVLYGRSNGPDSPHFALFDDSGRTPTGDRFAAWLAGWATTG